MSKIAQNIGINRSFLSGAKEIWETEVQRGFLLMPVMCPERNEVE